MGYRIKEVREEKRMTQEELSAKSGISRTTISGLENGTVRSTSTKTLLKIATALETTVDNIFLPIVFNLLNTEQERRTQ